MGIERRDQAERARSRFRQNGRTAQEEEGEVLATVLAGPWGPQEERQASGQKE